MKNGKKINIGVVCHRATSVGEVGVFGQNTAYFDYISRIANVVFISARDEHVHDYLDAIVLPGGADVEEMRSSSYQQGNTNPHATFFFRHMWKHYRHLPTLGICMGMQAVLMYDTESIITPHVNLPHSNPRWQLLDTLVDSQDGTPLNNIYNQEWKSNSIHHQAFYQENIDTTEYAVVGISKEFETVEVVVGWTLPHLLVQFHPEEMNCDTTLSYFAALIREFHGLDL